MRIEDALQYKILEVRNFERLMEKDYLIQLKEQKDWDKEVPTYEEWVENLKGTIDPSVPELALRKSYEILVSITT